MRVFVILLLVLPLFCPMTAQTRPVATTVDSTFVAKTDSLSAAIRDMKWRLDSLAIAKGQQEKLLGDAQDRFSQSLTILEVVLGFAALLAIILGWLGKSAISNFNKDMRALRHAKSGLEQQIRRARGAEAVFKDIAANLEERIAVVKEELSKTFASKSDIQKDLDVMRSEIGIFPEQFTSRLDVQRDMEKLRAEIGTVAIDASAQEEIRNKLEEFSMKLRDLERLGGSLTSEDYVRRAQVQYRKGLYDLALLSAENALELDEKSAGAWFARGTALAELNRSEEALSAYDKSIQYEDTARAHLGKSLVLDRLEKKEEAAAERAIAGQKWYRTAARSMEKGDQAKAMNYLAFAVVMNSSYKETARTDEAFRALWNDPDFKKIVGEG